MENPENVLNDYKKAGFEPMGLRVLVKPLPAEEQRTAGGLFLPDSQKKRGGTPCGEVIATGNGRTGKKNEVLQSGLKVGDKITYSTHHAFDIVINGEMFHVVSEEHIIGRYT
jgi:co-chaperonin GroES (HSP10)